MMRWIFSFLIFFMIFGASAFAEEGAVGACPECSNPETRPKVEELYLWSVSDDDVNNAHCVSAPEPREAEMLDYLHTVVATDPDQKETRTINGIEFENENPRFLSLFQELHRISDTSKKDQTPLHFSSKCHDVLCAMDEIYGKPQGTQIFYIYARYGYKTNTLTHNTNEYIPWRPSELDELISILQTLPPHFFPFANYERILLHSTISENFKNGKEVANSAIQVLQPWFDESKNLRQVSLTHEIGHDVAEEMHLDLSGDWMKTSGWNAGKPKDIPSPYAGTDPREDFAETFAAYRLSPEYLKKKSPQRYEYMKTKVFHGVEFTSEVACQKPFRDEENFIAHDRKIQQALVAQRKSDRQAITNLLYNIAHTPSAALTLEQTAKAFAPCLNQYLEEASVGHRGQADSCLTEHIRRAVVLTSMDFTLDSSLIKSSDLSVIPISEAQKKQVRDFAKNYLSPIFYETYKDDSAIQQATTPEECQTNAHYFYRSLSSDIRDAITNRSVIENVVSRACEERIKAFGTSLLGQKNNPFAKNTFDQVFNF